MKVSIFSFAVNDKFPIPIQYRQYEKFIQGDFEFILFNDAFEQVMANNINTTARHLHIHCVRVPQKIHIVQGPSEGYATTLNWAVRKYAVDNKCEIIVLVHTDVFPIEPINIEKILENNIVASVIEAREYNCESILYLYPALTIINMDLLYPRISEINFNCALGLDTGGATYTFVKKYAASIKFLKNPQIPIILDKIPYELKEYFKIDIETCKKYGLSNGWIANGFYHYLAGSQWNALEGTNFANGHVERMATFSKYFY